MEKIVFLITALLGALLSVSSPILGLSIEALAFLLWLNYMMFFKHCNLHRVLFPSMGGTAIAILIIFSFFGSFDNDKKAFTDEIFKNGGYFAVGEIKDKRAETLKGGRKWYTIEFKDVCNWDGSLVETSINVNLPSYEKAQIGDKYILAKKYEISSSFKIWNTNPDELDIIRMQNGMFYGDKSGEMKKKFYQPTLFMKILMWFNSGYGILISIVLAILFLVWVNKQDEKITIAVYNIIILCFFLMSMPDNVISFNCMLMMMCFFSSFMPWEARMRKSLKEKGGFVTIGELSMSKGKYRTYYIKIYDWNYIEQEYKQNVSQCNPQFYENNSKAIVILPLGIERTPIIVSTRQDMVESFEQSKFIESYEKISDIHKDESLELRGKFII